MNMRTLEETKAARLAKSKDVVIGNMVTMIGYEKEKEWLTGLHAQVVAIVENKFVCHFGEHVVLLDGSEIESNINYTYNGHNVGQLNVYAMMCRLRLQMAVTKGVPRRFFNQLAKLDSEYYSWLNTSIKK